MSNVATHPSTDESISSLKKQYSSELAELKFAFSKWSEEDLLATLVEAHGDVDVAISRITEGNAFQWTETKTKKSTKSQNTEAGAKNKENTPANNSASDQSRGERTDRGRGRGSFRGGRGGFRGGRGRGGANGHARVARPPRNNESNKPSSADDTNENAQRTNKNQTQSVSSAEQTATDNVGTSKQATNLGSGVWGDVNKKHVKQGWGPSKPQQPSAKQPTTASQTPSSAPVPSKPKQVPTPASQPTPKPATTMKTSWAQIVKTEEKPSQPLPTSQKASSPKKASESVDRQHQRAPSPKRGPSPQRAASPEKPTATSEIVRDRSPARSPAQQPTKAQGTSPSPTRQIVGAAATAASSESVTASPSRGRSPSPPKTKSPQMKPQPATQTPPGLSQQKPQQSVQQQKVASAVPAGPVQRGRTPVKEGPVVMPGSVGLQSVGVKFGSLAIGESQVNGAEETKEEVKPAEAPSQFPPQVHQRPGVGMPFPPTSGMPLPVPSAPSYNAANKDQSQSHYHPSASIGGLDAMNPYASYQHTMPGAAAGFGMGAPMSLPGEPYAAIYGAGPEAQRVMGYYADPSYGQGPHARDNKYAAGETSAPSSAANTPASTAAPAGSQPGSQQQGYPPQLPGIPYYYPYYLPNQFPSYQSSGYQPFVNKNMYPMYATPAMNQHNASKTPSSYNSSSYGTQSYEEQVNQGHHAPGLSGMNAQDFSKAQGASTQSGLTSHTASAASNLPHQQNFQNFLGLGSGLNPSQTHPQSHGAHHTHGQPQAKPSPADPLAFNSSQKSYPNSGGSTANQSPANQPYYAGTNAGNYYGGHHPQATSSAQNQQSHQYAGHHHQQQHQQHNYGGRSSGSYGWNQS
ncbi:hypothetical protein BKA69DRAFT_1083149 [Paraphysoderma sedebokerense]|nr:hypothetical protein BKA69DRAFT_1083149 [Paraphysoderma sedebokerense]